MPVSRYKRHVIRAWVGILSGTILALVAAVLCYFNYQPGQGTKWALLMLPALPMAAWGCAHLARVRGYTTGAGYGLFAFAFLTSGLIAGVHSPVTVGFSFVFVALMPPIVLFAMPNRAQTRD